MKTKCIIVGPFPPPIHGIAVANEAMLARMTGRGIRVHVINLAAATLNRSVLARAQRMAPFLRGFFRFASLGSLRDSSVYLSVSGGLGQVYESAFALLSRLRGARIFLHHHTYSYINAPNTVARSLFRGAGPAAIHVFLSAKMRKDFEALYGKRLRSMVVSNAALLPETPCPLVKQRLSTIGFLSNLAREKGVFDFLDLMRELGSKGMKIEGRLAGPFQDSEVEEAVRGELATLTNVEYLGPLFGEDKKRFWRDIDVFVFPTRYKNEAEPIVVLEALANGCPVVARSKGTIATLVPEGCGTVVEAGTDFVTEAARVICGWGDSPSAIRMASAHARKQFDLLRVEGCRELESILDSLDRKKETPG